MAILRESRKRNVEGSPYSRTRLAADDAPHAGEPDALIFDPFHAVRKLEKEPLGV